MSQQSEEGAVAIGGGGRCCWFISFLLFVSGLVMYLVCKDAEINGDCGGNQEIAEAGFIMLIVGSSLMGLSIALCVLFCICGTGAFCCMACNDI